MAENEQNGDTAHKGGWLRRLIDWAIFPISAGMATNMLVAEVVNWCADHAFSSGWQSALTGAAVVIAGLVQLYGILKSDSSRLGGGRPLFYLHRPDSFAGVSMTAAASQIGPSGYSDFSQRNVSWTSSAHCLRSSYRILHMTGSLLEVVLNEGRATLWWAAIVAMLYVIRDLFLYLGHPHLGPAAAYLPPDYAALTPRQKHALADLQGR
jgi:hypothetical protein